MITFLINQTTDVADNQKKERITLEHHYREKEKMHGILEHNIYSKHGIRADWEQR